MYDALHVLLVMNLATHYHRDRKDLKKIGIKLAKKTLPLTRQVILNRIIDSSTPLTTLAEQTHRYLSITQAACEVDKMGFPGMVIIGEEALPMDIKMLDAQHRAEAEGSTDIEFYKRQFLEDRAWILANETEMQIAGAHAAMNSLNLKRLKCDVLLFRNRGFSGVRTTYEVEPGVMSKFDRQTQRGSQYFAR